MIRLSGLKVPAVIMLLVMGITFMANGVILGAALSKIPEKDDNANLSTVTISNIIVGKEDPNYEDCSWYDIRCHGRNAIRYVADKANDFGCTYLDPIYLWPTEWC